jgi:saxitoxin biosynthesis operon SxtJ-like protein
MLRQFAGLWLLFFVGMAGWRAWRGHVDLRTELTAVVGLGIGAVGLWQPGAVRFIYTGWMIVAFPIGWTVSRLIMAAMFYGVFTPVALVFRLIGRDQLHLRRHQVRSYWATTSRPPNVGEYFRQS